MASIVLGAAGSAIGGAMSGAVGATIGTSLGRLTGGIIDNAVFGGGETRYREGPRLSDLAVQTSTYGKVIPLVYGTVRLAGNVIWSRPIKETATTTTSTSGGGGKGGGGGGTTQSTTNYSYSISLAVAICEGPIDEVVRIWADAKQLDVSLGTYRIYRGNEEQLPDPFIESFEETGSTPAYRGMAYVVVEDFPLADFGNRIPNFTFEVKKKAEYADAQEETLEQLIKSITLIPGSGEFVYDTNVQHKINGEEVAGGFAQAGNRVPINRHHPDSQANVKLALDQMQETLPNLEWVSVVVTWFGTSLDAGECEIFPGVEYKTGGTTTPDTWACAGYTRNTAYAITHVNDSPRYGGTPDDAGVLRLLDELNDRGLKVMFYPMFFMDVANKPWRGRVTGSAAEVTAFFTKTNGYNRFVEYYADLVKGKVDAFVIGSELIGLTKVTSGPGQYPAVEALIDLAASVKDELGSGVVVTYAADWSEYHHTDGGWYNLDALWASPHIDVVGIDAYFPLTEGPQNGYDVEAVRAGWTSGEGYDFYYSDSERTNQAPLGAPYAWKNIEWWWNNTHTNPDQSATDWVPQSKPIWFTEYGFPSVDGATNQPNVFFDPASQESFFPYHSRGRVDFLAQRTGLMATELEWKNSGMIERMFIWTWDARPFPYWPDLMQVWADGPQWKYGHWVQGKLGLSALAAIVADLCRRAGLVDGDFDVTRLRDRVDGYIVNHAGSAREHIEALMRGYFFDAVESDGLLKFVPRGDASGESIDEASLVPIEDGDGVKTSLKIRRQQEVELPQQVNVLFIDRALHYSQGNQFSQRQAVTTQNTMTLSLPIVLAEQAAKTIADKWLYSSWMGRTEYEWFLPLRYARLEPTDVVTLHAQGASHRIRIEQVLQASPGVLRIQGVADDVAAYDAYTPPATGLTTPRATPTLGETEALLLDLPAFPGDAAQTSHLRMGVTGLHAGWRGAVLYRSDDNGGSYERLAGFEDQAIVGTALTALANGSTAVADEAHQVDVLLMGNETLESVTWLALLNGANAALLGEEIIQFRYAELLAAGKYRLSGLLRGRLGTEHETGGHMAGERFVLLNNRLAKETVSPNLIGLPRLYKPVTVGATLGGTEAMYFTYGGRAWMPYAPVHVAGTRNGSDDLSIHWVRRTRAGGAWRDFVDTPLNEESERYELDVLAGGEVIRTLTANETSISYSAADQLSDFGDIPDSIDVAVYQISAVVGRGIPAYATI